MKLLMTSPVLVPKLNTRGSIEFNGCTVTQKRSALEAYLSFCLVAKVNPNNTLLFATFEPAFNILTKIKGILK